MTLAALLTGCAGLPPKPAAVTLPRAAPLAGIAAAGGAWPTPHWWRRYRDPTLDRLIDMALSSSPSLATAGARFASARESVRVTAAASGAHVALNGSFVRQRLSDNGLISPKLIGFTWYNQADLGLQASYTFDWWGKQRSAVEAATDEAQAARAERSAAALLLASSVADAYFGWQTDQSRLGIARRKIAALERDGAIEEARVRAGLDPAQSTQRSDSAVAAAREVLASLQGSAEMRIVAIAALVGRASADLPKLDPRPLPAVAGALPNEIKIDLIARRADITASRWRVEAAEKNSAAARAAFFPDISVNALAGLSSIDVGKLLEYGSRAPQAGLALHLPIFESGLLRARYGASRAALRGAIADYDRTLVEAAREVAGYAAARSQITAQLRQRRIEVDAARRLEGGAAAEVRQGIADARIELSARLALLDQQDALMRLDAAALSADVGLQRSLGGGYLGPRSLARLDGSAAKRAP
ncbi:MAG TPA: efflux transporter outer membrane subunit [Steroidobacteraceae bacterium]|nr:efflux transporter outer membrane subunit [Steroidobacteraceae bacterium]